MGKTEAERDFDFKVGFWAFVMAIVGIILMAWLAPSDPKSMYPGSSATYDGVVSDQSNH